MLCRLRFWYSTGSRARSSAAASTDSRAGMYPFSGSCAEVWSVTRSGLIPRRTSSGSTSAALPTTPMERPSPRSIDRCASRSASSSEGASRSRYPCSTRRFARAGSTSIPMKVAPHIAAASGCAPPTPPTPPATPPRPRERLVRALQDALGADVDPGPGGHLAVHDQPGPLQFPELLPGGPLRHQVGVRYQDARSIRMRAQHADGLSALYQQRLFVAERAERGADPLEARPVARRLPAPSVDHQLFRLLCHLGVEVVLQHPERSFLHPSPARERGAARGTDRVGHARFYDIVDRIRGWKTGAAT